MTALAARQEDAGRARFLSVAEVARLLGVSEPTVYREIREGRFPAIRFRGRYIVPTRAVEAMERAAIETGGLIDPSDWAPPDAPDVMDRPRPGANQTGAGSPVTQQRVRGAMFSMPDAGSDRTSGGRDVAHAGGVS